MLVLEGIIHYFNCLHKIYMCGFDEILERVWTSSIVSTNLTGCGRRGTEGQRSEEEEGK